MIKEIKFNGSFERVMLYSAFLKKLEVVEISKTTKAVENIKRRNTANPSVIATMVENAEIALLHDKVNAPFISLEAIDNAIRESKGKISINEIAVILSAQNTINSDINFKILTQLFDILKNEYVLLENPLSREGNLLLYIPE